MYSDPPPPSQFRRPWSPESHNHYHQPQAHRPFDYDYDHEYDSYTTNYDPAPQSGRREASDVSVEALDLADYAATLRLQHRNPAMPEYPPSPSLRPPPSLLSRGNTLLSNSAASSSRRPLSLPPPASHQYHAAVSDIDVSRFPPWARNWYNTDPRNTEDAPDFLSRGQKPDYFDPGYVHGRSAVGFGYPYDLPEHSSLPYPNASHSHSHKDSYGNPVPWSPTDQDPPSYHGHSSQNGGVDMETKQARMRLLEREFGANAPSSKGHADDDFLDENGKPLVGTVDHKGNIVTQGPKKRLATRLLQIALALTAAIPSIYAALVIKPDPAPPPAMKPPALALYVLSVITSILLAYLFLFRPCCCGPRRKNKGLDAANPLANGMVVLPVPGMAGGKNKHKGGGGKPKKGKKGKMMGPPGGGDVQVNLIVDPGMFHNGAQSDSEGEDESMPGGYYSGDPFIGGRKRRRKAKRRSIFAGLAMEAEWKRARSWLKKITAVDVVLTLLWGVEFVLIMIGKRCPTGGYEGWCNAYNVSSAAACLLSVISGVAIFFDVKDLNTMTTTYIYHVIRETENHRNGTDSNNEFRGSFWTKREANRLVKSDLYDEWDEDFFEEYEEETDDDGLVTVRATCPEGEEMTVYVQKLPVPPGKPPASYLKQHGINTGNTPNSTHVWMVLVSSFDEPADKVGRQTVWRNATFNTLKTANDSAIEALLEVAGSETMDDVPALYEFTERGSEKEAYRARTVVEREDIYAAGVEVKRAPVLTNIARKRKESDSDSERDSAASDAEGPERKRRKGGSSPEVIEILSDADSD